MLPVYKFGVVLLACFLSIGAVPPVNEPDVCNVDELCRQKYEAIKTLLTPRISQTTWAAAKEKLDKANASPVFVGMTNHEKKYIMSSMFRIKSLTDQGLPSWYGKKVGDHQVYLSKPAKVCMKQPGPEGTELFVLPRDKPSLRPGDLLLVDLTSAYYPKDSPPNSADKLEYHNSLIFYRHDQQGGQTVYLDCNKDEVNRVTKYVEKGVYAVMEGMVSRKKQATIPITFHRFQNSQDVTGRVCTIFTLWATQCIMKADGYDGQKINGKSAAELSSNMNKLQKDVLSIIREIKYPILQ